MDRSTGNTHNVSKEQNTPGIERCRFRPYPQYKDFGVEWLGKIPAHWDITRTKEQFCIVNGSTPSSSEPSFWDGDIVWVTPDDLGELHESRLGDSSRKITEEGYKSCGTSIVPKGSILVSTRAPIGYVAIATTNLCTNQGCKSLVPKRLLNNGFFYYQLSSAKCELESRGQGSTFRELSRDKLGQIILARPPEPEQHAIASFLDRETAKIDALVEKKERLIELLQEKRAALITQAVTRGLDPTVPMKDSGVEWLGEIPTHWALVPLKSITLARPGSIKTGPFGSQLLASDMAQEEIKVYNQRNVIAHDFTAGENYISMSKFRELASFEVFKNDILVTTRGTIGKSAIVPNGAERGILHPCLLRIQPDSDKIKIAYLALIIQESNLVINQLALASNATTIDVIYSDTIGRVLIPCPPINEQSAIFEFLDGMTVKIDALMSKIREAITSLREYRTALISAAVTGKIDVREG